MIRSIRVIDGLVVNEGGRIQSPLAPIFVAEDDQESDAPRPAAFTSGRAGTDLLEVVVEVPTAADYELEGTLEGYRLFAGKALASGAGVLAIQVQLVSTPSEIAALRGREIHWSLRSGGSADPLAEQTLHMELYFVRSAPGTALRKGLSLEVLRLIALMLEERGRFEVLEDHFGFGYGAEIDIVEWCFQRNPPKYDIRYGAPHYCDAANFDKIKLFLNAYLNANKDPKAICNCYDVASALQHYLITYGYMALWAQMEPFGYLRTTQLTGRGLCNNPFYYNAQKMVPDNDRARTFFHNHAFCILAGPKVADATVGPHTGNESQADYVDYATDNNVPQPPASPRGTSLNIKYYRGVTTVISISRQAIEQNINIHNLDSFKAAVDYEYQREQRGIATTPLAVTWPDLGDCPQLEGWTTGFDETSAGYPEVRRQWLLRRGEESLTVTVYSASDDGTTAHRRFLAVGSIHSSTEAIFERGPEGLGDCSARAPDGSRLLWLFHSVVVDIRSRSVTVEFAAVAHWLQGKIQEGDLAGTPPPVHSLNAPERVRQGEILVVEVACAEGMLVEYAGGHGGLRLVDEDGRRLTFQAMEPAEDELHVVVVDPATLLASVISRKITVEG